MYIYIYYLGTWTLRIDHARAVHVRYIPLVCNMPATSNPGLTWCVRVRACVCVCARVCVCVVLCVSACTGGLDMGPRGFYCGLNPKPATL